MDDAKLEELLSKITAIDKTLKLIAETNNLLGLKELKSSIAYTAWLREKRRRLQASYDELLEYLIEETKITAKIYQ